MTTLLAIEKTITTFQELSDRLGLNRSPDGSFFPEWQNLTVRPNQADQRVLDRLKERYFYYYNAGVLTEGSILVSMVAPLLEHLGFHEPPFFVRSEVPVQLEVQERDEVYRGRLDILVVREQLWIVTVEAKHSKLAVDSALPQCLTYMAASNQPMTFGFVTNGSDFIFCKLEDSIYDFSDPFSLLSRQNRLYEVAEILLRLKKTLNSEERESRVSATATGTGH